MKWDNRRNSSVIRHLDYLAERSKTEPYKPNLQADVDASEYVTDYSDEPRQT